MSMFRMWRNLRNPELQESFKTSGLDLSFNLRKLLALIPFIRRKLLIIRE